MKLLLAYRIAQVFSVAIKDVFQIEK